MASGPAQVPTSLIVQAALDSKPPSSPSDPWAPDTIADGTPIETHRGADPSVLQRASTGKKSFLVDRAAPLSDPDPTADMTAEDGAISSGASSSASSSSSDED